MRRGESWMKFPNRKGVKRNGLAVEAVGADVLGYRLGEQASGA